MIPDKVLYTDGHDVIVTDSVFQVRKDQYKINGITKHGLLTVKPHRLPGVLLMILGVIVGALGVFQRIPTDVIPDMPVRETLISGNTMAIALGLLLIVIGLLVTAMMRERYAVRIATAEGEKNVIVSSHKDYVMQIVRALNEAFNFTRPVKGFSRYSVR